MPVRWVLWAVLISAGFHTFAFGQVPDLAPRTLVACRDGTKDPSGCVSPPRQTYAPKPKYPEKERKAHREGVVTLWLMVGTDGTPSNIRVHRSLGEEFDRTAVDAVKLWK